MFEWLISTVGGWVVVAVVGAVGIVSLNLFSKTGRLVRAGLETKKSLGKARVEMVRQGMTPNEKFHALDKNASLKIVLPIVGLLGVYSVIFFAAPITVFLFCLLLLIAPVVGFCGYEFTGE